MFSVTDAELADQQNANRLIGAWNGLPSLSRKEPSSPVYNNTQGSIRKKETGKSKDRTNELMNQQCSPSKPSPKPEVKVKPPLAPKPQLPPKPQIIPPKSPKRGRSYAHCNGDASGRLSSELLEMEPDTMEFKSVTSGGGGLSLSSNLITAVRCTKDLQPAQTPQTEENTKKQEVDPKHSEDKIDTHVTSFNKSSGADDTETCKDQKGNETALTAKKSPNPPTIPRSNSGTKLVIPPPVPPKPITATNYHPLSLPASSPVSPTDPDKGIFKDSISPPNGIHPWSSRNGSVQSGARRVSLSHESLSPKNTAPLTLTTSLISTNSKGVGCLEIKETGRSGSGSDLRTSSSSLGGRLPASSLRGKIQALPWYMTRSQEILGNLDYPSSSSINGDTSGFGSGLSVASGLSDLNKTPVKEKENINIKSGAKGSFLEEGAEVVIATIKDAEEVTTYMKKANGTNSSHLNLISRENSGAHRGGVSSEQPQSRPHSAVGLGGVCSMQIGGDSPTSSYADSTPPQQHREACGCRTVYANCFSGDTEDSVSFDEELTVYEFSRRTNPKPPRPAPASSPTTPCPNPNLLSLLRDNPRPLSTFSTASSEISPLVSCPVSPTTSGGCPLRSLTNKNYGGLKGGFASLRQDIDQLLLVLERGALEQPQQISGQESKQDNTDLNHNGTEENTNQTLKLNCTGTSTAAMTEAERTLLQAEARRLASGCQRATRVGWAPDEALRSLSNSFNALVQLSKACMRRNSCTGCDICQNKSPVYRGDDDDRQEPMDKLKEIVGLYKEFVGAVETAGTGVRVGAKATCQTGSGQGEGESDGVRLLAKHCNVLISSVFALTQLFRTCTLSTTDTPGHVPLNF